MNPAKQDINWRTVIIDEAHRMKSTGSSTRAAIQAMHTDWLLLLTGGAAAGLAGAGSW
jgi:SNF2 family DNA or RNA helicase